jgi:hypothetical protein
MNAGRYVGAALGVGVVRVLLNYLFYGVLTHDQLEQMSAAHPGVFREVVPGFIATDLVFAFVAAYLFVKVGGALGGGVKAGVVLGIFAALLGPVVGNFYIHFSVTYFPLDAAIKDGVFQLLSYAIQGAVAGAVYKS